MSSLLPCSDVNILSMAVVSRGPVCSGPHLLVSPSYSALASLTVKVPGVLVSVLALLCSLLGKAKAMAAHSSTLSWRVPRTEEPGGLQSMGSLRVGYDWVASLSLLTFMHCRRKWQPTPVFLRGQSQGWGSLVGCHLWGRTESDLTQSMISVSITCLIF